MSRNVISEVIRVREIMGLLTEQNEKRMTLPFDKTFKAGYWKISPEVQSQIDSLMGQVKSFVEKHTGNVIKLTVNSGESQITNFDREQNPAVSVKQGYLSTKRYETILNYLKDTYPNLLKNLRVEKQVIVGDTPYNKSEFAQNCGNQGEKRDSATCKSFFKKYEPEQFINFTIEVLGKKEPTPTTTPVIKSPLCGVKIGGRGERGNSENNFISINKTVNTKGVPADFTATITSYAIPDRTQIYGIKNDDSRVLLVDTGYFGKSTTRDDNVGGLSYHYNNNPSSNAFQSTELSNVKIKEYNEPIELLRDIYKNVPSTLVRINNGYERRKDDRRELENYYERYLDRIADNYPKEYSLWKLWEGGVRKFVLFNDEEREVVKKFKINNTYKQLQVIVYGPLAKTVSRVELSC